MDEIALKEQEHKVPHLKLAGFQETKSMREAGIAEEAVSGILLRQSSPRKIQHRCHSEAARFPIAKLIGDI